MGQWEPPEVQPSPAARRNNLAHNWDTLTGNGFAERPRHPGEQVEHESVICDKEKAFPIEVVKYQLPREAVLFPSWQEILKTLRNLIQL